jgi:hypothetical protein
MYTIFWGKRILEINNNNNNNINNNKYIWIEEIEGIQVQQMKE